MTQRPPNQSMQIHNMNGSLKGQLNPFTRINWPFFILRPRKSLFHINIMGLDTYDPSEIKNPDNNRLLAFRITPLLVSRQQPTMNLTLYKICEILQSD
jgi:hypothetical protein